MERKSFIILLKKFYKGLMTQDEASHLVRAYCKQFGNDEHVRHLEQFIDILRQDLLLQAYCIKHIIEKYELEFSVVKIYAKNYDMQKGVGKLITVY